MVRNPHKRAGGALKKALAKARFKCPEFLDPRIEEHWLAACQMAPKDSGEEIVPSLVTLALAFGALADYNDMPADAKPTTWNKSRREAVSEVNRCIQELKKSTERDGAVPAAERIFDRMEAFLGA